MRIKSTLNRVKTPIKVHNVLLFDVLNDTLTLRLRHRRSNLHRIRSTRVRDVLFFVQNFPFFSSFSRGGEAREGTNRLKQKFFASTTTKKNLHFPNTRSLRLLAALHTEQRKKPHTEKEEGRVSSADISSRSVVSSFLPLLLIIRSRRRFRYTFLSKGGKP